MRPTIVLLPGLDGTGELFENLQEEFPSNLKTRVVSYPRDRFLPYSELVDAVGEMLPRDEPFVVAAESFSQGQNKTEIRRDSPDCVHRPIVCIVTIQPS